MNDVEVNGVAARHSSATNEWFTPREIVDASRMVLGTIDLDPFSCAKANEIVRASRYYSIDGEDGFAVQWFGNVFVNPPGSVGDEGSNQKRAWFKLAAEHAAGRVTSAIFVGFSVELLQTTQVDAPLYLPSPLDFPILYPRTRLAYLTTQLPGPTPKRPKRKPTKQQLADHAATGLCTGEAPPHSSCIVYLPPRSKCRDMDCRNFRGVFAPIGKVVIPS